MFTKNNNYTPYQNMLSSATPFAKKKVTKLVYVFPGDQGACGWYRLIQPFGLLQQKLNLPIGQTEALEKIYDGKLGNDPGLRLDVVPGMIVTQRQTEIIQADFYKKLKKNFYDVPVKMDIDDVLWIHNPLSFYKLHKTQIKALGEVIALSTTIVTSTPQLAEQIRRKYKVSAKVSTNYIHEGYYVPPKEVNNERPKVVWGGSPTHINDIAIISSIIVATHKDIEWVMLGWCPEELKKYVTFINGVEVKDYLPLIASVNADLAVAPLADNLFNSCKSHLKLLEFAACGLPVLTSDVDPYKGNPLGCLPPKANAWKQAILELAFDKDARKDAAIKSFIWAQQYKLESNLHNIAAAWL